MNAFLTIALLTLFVVLHELGHYVSAKRSKIAVSDFLLVLDQGYFLLRKTTQSMDLKLFHLVVM